MPIVYLIRHGRTESGNPHDADPGLDAVGRAQAIEAAEQCIARLPQCLPLISSPLRRCRETAAPLAEHWRSAPTIDPNVRELPSPLPEPLVRARWLAEVLPGTWQALAASGERQSAGYSERLVAWRAGLLQAACCCSTDSVIVTHFVAINSLVAEALGSDRVSGYQPNNASITVIQTNGDGSRTIQLLERGRETVSRIV